MEYKLCVTLRKPLRPLRLVSFYRKEHKVNRKEHKADIQKGLAELKELM